MGLSKLDISNAFDAVNVAASTAFNDSSPVPIKDIRADAAGQIDVVTEYGTAVTFNALKGERLNLQGLVEIVNTTTVATQVYLQKP